MRRIAIAVAVLAACAAPAAAAQEPAKLTVKRVGKPPASIQVGATFAFAVRVTNAKHHQASGGRVTVTLRTASGRKRVLAGATLRKQVKGGATSTVTFSIPVRTSVPTGTYDLVACVRATGHRNGDCKTARTLAIVR
jgi:hypothetical protein